MAIREEVKSFKQQRILEEASTLFHERGFSGTSLDAIAERLSVTKPVIYQHFKNKGALLVEIYLSVVNKSLACIDVARASATSPSDRIRIFIHEYVHLVIGEQKTITIFFREDNHIPEEHKQKINHLKGVFDDRLSELLYEGVRAGEFKLADVRMATLAIVGMTSWIYTWYRSDGRLSASEIVEIMTEAIERIVGYQFVISEGL